MHPALYKGSCDYGLKYAENEKLELLKCSHSDWVRSVDGRRSTSGSHASVVISWSSEKQQKLVLSLMEAQLKGTETTVSELWSYLVKKIIMKYRTRAGETDSSVLWQPEDNTDLTNNAIFMQGQRALKSTSCKDKTL